MVTADDNDNDIGMELTSHPRDAFEDLKNSATINRRSQLSGDCSEFVKLINQRNKKDKLFNDIVEFLKSNHLSLVKSTQIFSGILMVIIMFFSNIQSLYLMFSLPFVTIMY